MKRIIWELTSVKHNLAVLPLHVLMSAYSTHPLLQLHVYDPSVFSH